MLYRTDQQPAIVTIRFKIDGPAKEFKYDELFDALAMKLKGLEVSGTDLVVDEITYEGITLIGKYEEK